MGSRRRAHVEERIDGRNRVASRGAHARRNDNHAGYPRRRTPAGVQRGLDTAGRQVGRSSLRWWLVWQRGLVPVARWLADRLVCPGRYEANRDRALPDGGRWPRAARFDGRSGDRSISVSFRSGIKGLRSWIFCGIEASPCRRAQPGGFSSHRAKHAEICQRLPGARSGASCANGRRIAAALRSGRPPQHNETAQAQ